MRSCNTSLRVAPFSTTSMPTTPLTSRHSSSSSHPLYLPPRHNCNIAEEEVELAMAELRKNSCDTLDYETFIEVALTLGGVPSHGLFCVGKALCAEGVWIMVDVSMNCCEGPLIIGRVLYIPSKGSRTFLSLAQYKLNQITYLLDYKKSPSQRPRHISHLSKTSPRVPFLISCDYHYHHRHRSSSRSS